MERLGEVHIDAARPRERGREFGAHERPDQGQDPGEEPHEQHPADRVHLARDFGGLHEDGRADDGPDDHRGRMRETNGSPKTALSRHPSPVPRHDFSSTRKGLAFGLKLSLPTSTSWGFGSPSICSMNLITVVAAVTLKSMPSTSLSVWVIHCNVRTSSCSILSSVRSATTGARPGRTARTRPAGPRTVRGAMPGRITFRSSSTSIRLNEAMSPPSATTRPWNRCSAPKVVQRNFHVSPSRQMK